MKRKILLIALITVACCCTKLTAQNLSVKTNIIYDATRTINLGTELSLAEKWTFDLSGNWNSFEFEENKKWKHWMVQPELRYWLCRKFGGHFFAGHLLGGQYNAGNIDGLPKILNTDFGLLADYRYEGWFVGAGIGYGYAWMLGKHWNLEVEIGLGVAYTEYDKFECETCGDKVDQGKHVYVGPTKAALNLVYVF